MSRCKDCPGGDACDCRLRDLARKAAARGGMVGNQACTVCGKFGHNRRRHANAETPETSQQSRDTFPPNAA